MRLFKSSFGSLVLLGLVAGGAGTAGACGKGELLYEDRFETLDAVWDLYPYPDEAGAKYSVGPNGLVYSFEPGYSIGVLNQSEFYDNYEVCAVYTTRLPRDSETLVGVRFWGSDYDNLYQVMVYPAWGEFYVERRQNGKWLTPIPNKPSDAVNRGTDATNEISVTVNGNKATLVINGVEMPVFKGRPPQDGSFFGFVMIAGESDSGPSKVTLESIQLRTLEGQVASARGPQRAKLAATAWKLGGDNGQAAVRGEMTKP
jgi:hypothetical protein